MHLEKYALTIFHVMPEKERKDYMRHSGGKVTRKIISRSLLHDIGKLLASRGKPQPKLEKPSTTQQHRSHCMIITADDKSVSAPYCS